MLRHENSSPPGACFASWVIVPVHVRPDDRPRGDGPTRGERRCAAGDRGDDRAEEDENRPPLSGDESFAQILKRRDPWYRRAADHVVECGERSKSALAREILDWFYRDLGIS